MIPAPTRSPRRPLPVPGGAPAGATCPGLFPSSDGALPPHPTVEPGRLPSDAPGVIITVAGLGPRRRPAVPGGLRLAGGREVTGKLEAVPVTLAQANAFVAEKHRHHPPVVGHKFSIGAAINGRLVGVCIVGRPVSRHRDDGLTLEVTRLCTDGHRNACSFLYGRAARAAHAMGFLRIGTYTTPDEGGASLRAAGWCLISQTPGRSWSVPSRPRADAAHPLGIKTLWEAAVAPGGA